jgi:hypothetical protein
MTRFIPKLIFLNGWHILIFDFSQLGDGRSSDEISKLPDEDAIKEFLYPWLGNPPHEYRLKKYLKLKQPSENSILNLRDCSNRAVNRILLHYSDPFQPCILYEEQLRRFCDTTPIPYEYVEFYLLARRYFNMMLPAPIDLKDHYPMSARMDLWNKSFSHLPNDLAKPGQKISNWTKMLSTRFSLYATSYSQLSIFEQRFWESDEGKEFRQLLPDNTPALTKERRKLKKLKEVANTPESLGNFNLRQCWFCGEFYLSPIANNNNYSRCCADEKCKRSHKAWVTALSREVKSPKILGL